MSNTASAQDYLESILVLAASKPAVRSKDIAEYFGFSKPSVSVAMKKLKEDGQIIVDTSGYITLTAEGKKIADEVYNRHKVLLSWLKSIGVPEEIAEKDACIMEHIISEETFEAIKRL